MSNLGRNRDLARIHLAKKELGLEDDTYRELLTNLTGKNSAKDLDARQRWKVLLELGKLGARAGTQGQTHQGTPPKPQFSKVGLVKKIEAQLAEAKRPWAYAHAMAKRMFQVDQVQWCEVDQLRRIVAALTYDAKRHGRSQQKGHNLR